MAGPFSAVTQPAFSVYGYARSRKKGRGRLRSVGSAVGASALGTGVVAAATVPGFLARRVGLSMAQRELKARQWVMRGWSMRSAGQKAALAKRIETLSKVQNVAARRFIVGTRLAHAGKYGALAAIAAYGVHKWRKTRKE